MKFSEKGDNAIEYFYNLSLKDQLVAAGVAVAGLATISGIIISANEDYRGFGSVDCYGNRTMSATSGQTIDEVVAKASETIAVSPSDIDDLTKIFLHDNPNVYVYDPDTLSVVLKENVESVIIPERCD